MSVLVTLKQRFLQAVVSGELGVLDDQGVIVTLKDFRDYFSDIKTQYVMSFLPAATIEVGQQSASHTKFVFRLRKGVYRVHPDAIEVYIEQLTAVDLDGVLLSDGSLTDDASGEGEVSEASGSYELSGEG